MSEPCEKSILDFQMIAEGNYAALKKAVEEAGFFVCDIIGEEHFERCTCTSKFRTGRIAFVNLTEMGWYISTPHPFSYRVIDAVGVEQAVVSFLGRQDGWQQCLPEVSVEEYEHAIARPIRV